MSNPMFPDSAMALAAAADALPPGGVGGLPAAAPAGLSPVVAAELQDHLLVAGNDLERLERLLADAGQSLMTHFCAASGDLRALAASTAVAADPAAAQTAARVLGHLAGAVTALQFQDMSEQLIAHSVSRLRGCADRLAAEVFGEDEDGPAAMNEMPTRPNPVTQDEMDAGSIELF